MTKIALPLLASALALFAPQAASAAQVTAVTSANIVKPVQLTKLQDMDFGTLLVNNYTGTRTITLSRAGVITCSVDITCSGATKQARFNIQGTNNMVVLITVSGGTLANGGNTIPFTANAPASITLQNSGAPGSDVDVGGSLSVSGTIPAGLYTGTMTVNADYQ